MDFLQNNENQIHTKWKFEGSNPKFIKNAKYSGSFLKNYFCILVDFF